MQQYYIYSSIVLFSISAFFFCVNKKSYIRQIGDDTEP